MASNTDNSNNNIPIVYKILQTLLGGYAKAMYGPMRVIIDKYGMINLTELARDSGADFNVWKEYDFAKNIIEAHREKFLSDGGIAEQFERVEKSSSDPRCNGIYGSRHLAIILNSLIDIDFGAYASDIIGTHSED